MWINSILIGWKSLWQDVSYQRLAIALLLSAILHLFLIGKFHFNLPYINEGRHVIVAQLVLPKSVPAKVATKPLVEDTALPKQVPLEQEAYEAKPEIPAPSDPALPSDAIPINDQVSPTISDAAAKSTEPADESQPEESALNISPTAYQYIETEFDVRTDIEAKVDSSPEGNAKVVYQLLPNGEQYQLKSLIQAKGLAALFIPDLLQTSDGRLSSTGLQPQYYLYQFGDKKNKTYSADFDWESKKLSLHNAKGDQTLDLTEGTQDLLSFMYQFMFVAPMQNMQLSITNGKKLGIYNYSFEGEETIATKMGKLKTIHLLRSAAEGEKKTELWLALDYQYVPVKIRETEKEGKVYELLVTSLKTEKPANPSQ